MKFDKIDPIAWRDNATQYRCLVAQVPLLGHLCGYVRIPRTHALYGKHDSAKLQKIFVHGGVTFSKTKKSGRWLTRGHWIGFDCAHYGDLVPGVTPEAYAKQFALRDVEYVKYEIDKLVRQLYRLR
jgi:hypothetical protein